MMSAKLYSNDLEGKVDEFIEIFDELYAKPFKKASKKANDFVFNPKDYGCAALYGAGYGTYTYMLNDDKDFLVRAGAAAFRFGASLILGRQVLRSAQLIGKKIKNPWVAYPVGMAVPYAAWAFVVYGTLSLMGAEHLTQVMIVDAVLTPPAIFGPMYFERNNIEVHPFRNAINHIKKKRGKSSDYEKL